MGNASTGAYGVRSLTAADVSELCRWMGSAEMQAKLEDQPLSPSAIADKLERLVGCDPQRDLQGAYVVTFGGQAVGYFHLMWLNWIGRTGEIDLMVNPACHLSRVTLQVFLKVGEIAFGQLNLSKIYAYIYASNTVSISVFRRVLTIEATQIAGRRPARGADEDVFLVAFTVSDFRAFCRRIGLPRTAQVAPTASLHKAAP